MLKHSSTQTDKITHLHLESVTLLPPSSQFSSPFSCTLHYSRRYFHSRKCWVTKGSTSSQQSGLKFNESPDAYFIVLCPLSIMLYILRAVCLSSPFLSTGDLFSMFVLLLSAANCTYVAVFDVPSQ